MQGLVHVAHAFFLINIAFGDAFHLVGVLRHDLRGQRFEAFLARDGGAGAAFGLVGEIQVLDFLHRLGVQYLLLQFGREFLLFADGGDDALLAFLQFGELFEAVLHGGHVLLVHRAGHLLTVACDEGDGGAFVQEAYDVGHMMRGLVEFLRDLRGEVGVLHDVCFYGAKIAFSWKGLEPARKKNPNYDSSNCFFSYFSGLKKPNYVIGLS